MNLLAPVSGWIARTLKGLAAAALGGAVTVVVAAWADPAHICFTSDCLRLLSKEAMAGAMIAVLAYFKTPHRDPDTRSRDYDDKDDTFGSRRSSSGRATSYRGKGTIG